MVATAVAARVALCVTPAGVWGQVRGGRAVVAAADAAPREILCDLGVFGGQQAVDCALPTHWGPLRRRAYEQKLQEVTGDVTVRSLAVVAVEAHLAGVGLPTRNVVVVEVAAPVVTVSLVGVRPNASRVLGCEHRARSASAETLAVVRGLVDTVLGDRMPDAVLVLADDATCESFEGVAGSTTPVHRVDPRALVASVAAAPPARVAERAEPAEVWWPAPAAPNRSRRVGWLVGAVLVATVACGAAVAATAGSEPEVIAHDRISFELPAQWRVRPGFPDPSGRIELIPQEGTGTRIVLISNPLPDGVGYDEVADALADRIAARGADGPFSGLDSDVVFAGRPGLTYREVPEPDSVVDWHVLVDRSMQVSIGCQRRADAVDRTSGDRTSGDRTSGDRTSNDRTLNAACERVVGSLAVTG